MPSVLLSVGQVNGTNVIHKYFVTFNRKHRITLGDFPVYLIYEEKSGTYFVIVNYLDVQ